MYQYHAANLIAPLINNKNISRKSDKVWSWEDRVYAGSRQTLPLPRGGTEVVKTKSVIQNYVYEHQCLISKLSLTIVEPVHDSPTLHMPCPSKSRLLIKSVKDLHRAF